MRSGGDPSGVDQPRPGMFPVNFDARAPERRGDCGDEGMRLAMPFREMSENYRRTLKNCCLQASVCSLRRRPLRHAAAVLRAHAKHFGKMALVHLMRIPIPTLTAAVSITARCSTPRRKKA